MRPAKGCECSQAAPSVRRDDGFEHIANDGATSAAMPTRCQRLKMPPIREAVLAGQQEPQCWLSAAGFGLAAKVG